MGRSSARSTDRAGAGLDAFAAAEPGLAAALMPSPRDAGAGFAAAFESALERSIRSAAPGPDLERAADGFATVLASPGRGAFIAALAASARAATRHRSRTGALRAVWGTTPIINLGPLSAAARRLGFESETLVHTTYHLTHEFDVILRAQREWVERERPDLVIPFYWLVFAWALLRYDVFHYFNDRGILLPTGGYGSRMGINPEEMAILARAGKRLFTLPYGADHRTRARTLALGKFNFCMDCPSPGRFCICDDAGGARTLRTIGLHATAMLASGLSVNYLPYPVDVDILVVDPRRFEPAYPAPQPGRPLRVVHAPNHPFFKGTAYLEQAVRELQAEGLAIDLALVSGVPNREVLELVRSADVVADQFIGGSYGYFAVEAMALGKPVLCYLRDPSAVIGAAECPIINVDPDSLKSVLARLAADPSQLAAIGRDSRRYVEKYLSIDAFAERLRRVYLDRAGLSWPAVRKLSVSGNPAIAFVRGRAIFAATAARRAWSRLTHACATTLEGALFRPEGSHKSVRDLARSFATRAEWLALRFAALAARLTVIPAMVLLGRAATAARLRWGTPRSVWGTTPILTLSRLAGCDRKLGLASESLVFSTYHISQEFDRNLAPWHARARSAGRLVAGAFWAMTFAYALLRYDIFHFFCDRGLLPSARRIGIRPREMELLRRAGKRLYTYTYGADVRTRQLTLALGRFNFCMDCPEPGKYCQCDDATGAANVASIARYATRMLAMGDMKAYVPGAMDLHFWPLEVGSIPFAGTSWRPGERLRIAHAPNHPFFKGTRHLLEAVTRLRGEGHDIELVQIQGVPNAEVLRRFAEVHLVAEQFIGGFHGYTALEAMAVGKPVIAYLRGPDMVLEASQCPIISADPDTLFDVLRDCLRGKYDLAELGRRGRAYVSRFYSSEAVAARLGNLYLESAALPPRLDAALRAAVARETESCLALAAHPA